MPDDIAIPVFAGLAVGIAFIVLFSLFLGSAIPPPQQTGYGELDGLAVTRLSEEWQPWLAPPNGVPHLWIIELATDPDTPDKVSYDEAPWLHRAMDDRGNLAETEESIDIGREIRVGTVIMLDNAEKEAFFDSYRQKMTDTPFFQVTFPDGLVKHYDVRFFEVT